MPIRKGFGARREAQVDEKLSLVRMLTVQEVSEVLNVHPDTVRHWSDHGLLRTYRIGPRGDRRFSWEDVSSFLRDKGDVSGIGKRHRGKVLIVDDDYRIRDLLGDAVQKQGQEAISVDSGERALEELEKQDFALVFLDLILPGVSGVDVLRAIKVRDIKAVVAVVTGHGEGPIASEVISLGPFFFIRKPFDMADITEVLHVALGVKGEVSGQFGAGQREIQRATFE